MLKYFFYFLLLLCSTLFSETAKIVYISDFSGDSAKELWINYQGLQMAVDEINSEGGILGQQIEIIKLDNQSSALGSKLAAEKAVKLNPTAILGCPYSSYALAAVDIIQHAQIPFITESATNPDITKAGNYIFRVCFTDEFQGRILADFAIKELKSKKAAILVDAGSVYSKGLADIFETEYSRHKGKITAKYLYSENEKDFTTYLKKIADQQPDLIFLPAHQTEAGLIIYQAMKMNLKSKLLGGDGWGADMLNDYAKNTAQNCYFSVPWSTNKNDKAAILFISDFKKKYGINTPMDAGAAQAYDAIKILAHAIKKADSFEHDKIREALAAITDFQGISGKISYQNGRDPVKSVFINELKKDKIILFKEIKP